MLHFMSSTTELKRQAARAALALLPESGVVGLGSGSTAALFVEELALLVQAGRKLTGVPTSSATRALAESLGIPLLADDRAYEVDVCVDGADELTESLSAIKGGGGAHTREKIVNRAAALNVIIVDEGKLVQRLGERAPVPVEVLDFAHLTTANHLRVFGQPRLRMMRAHTNAAPPFRTDAGNLIYDVSVDGIDDPGTLSDLLKRIPGVVETGIFFDIIDIALVAGVTYVRRIERPGTTQAVRSHR
jgi:ribose 5-phosphate isomerase A